MATFNQAVVIHVFENAGSFTAKAFRNGETFLLASESAAARATAVSNCVASLANTIYGDLRELPLVIVDKQEPVFAS